MIGLELEHSVAVFGRVATLRALKGFQPVISAEDRVPEGRRVHGWAMW